MSEENDKVVEEEFDSDLTQEEHEQAAWAARGWDFEEPEVDEKAKAELDELHGKIHGGETGSEDSEG